MVRQSFEHGNGSPRRFPGWRPRFCNARRREAAENQAPVLDVYLLGFVSGAEPFPGSHIVLRVIAPPGAMASGAVGELCSQNTLELGEGHRDCVLGLRT